MLTDKNGNEISIGDTLLVELEVKTGEYTKTRKRTKTHYDIRGMIKFHGVVRFGDFGGTITYYIETSETHSYFTHFYSGIGRTRAEKRANEYVEVKSNLSRVLTTGLCKSCEIVRSAAAPGGEESRRAGLDSCDD